MFCENAGRKDLTHVYMHKRCLDFPCVIVLSTADG